MGISWYMIDILGIYIYIHISWYNLNPPEYTRYIEYYSCTGDMTNSTPKSPGLWHGQNAPSHAGNYGPHFRRSMPGPKFWAIAMYLSIYIIYIYDFVSYSVCTYIIIYIQCCMVVYSSSKNMFKNSKTLFDLGFSMF